MYFLVLELNLTCKSGSVQCGNPTLPYMAFRTSISWACSMQKIRWLPEPYGRKPLWRTLMSKTHEFVFEMGRNSNHFFSVKFPTEILNTWVFRHFLTHFFSLENSQLAHELTHLRSKSRDNILSANFTVEKWFEFWAITLSNSEPMLNHVVRNSFYVFEPSHDQKWIKNRSKLGN